jgi:hypothetical protein
MTQTDRPIGPYPLRTRWAIALSWALCTGACSQDAASPATRTNSDTEPGSAACTRTELSQAIDDYRVALAARDPQRLQLATPLRFTENGKLLTLGEGLWESVDEVTFHRDLLDPESCGAVAQVVVTKAGSPALLGLRLKLSNARISEVETILAGKEQDEDPDARVPLYTDVVANTPLPEWDEVVDLSRRSSREELNHIADLYFDGFRTANTPEFEPVPFAEDCRRFENGLDTTNPDRGGCKSTFVNSMGSADRAVTNRRYPVADVERGITAVFANFRDFWIDFHMFKVEGGEVRLVLATFSSFASEDKSTGWEDHEMP